MTKISIIVTNWNAVGLLKKYMPYVLKNSPEASEIIFADDASPDASVEYVASLQKKDNRLRIITHKENVGFGKNSNHAVKSAVGEYVVLLNSDILPHLGYITAALKHFRGHPELFGVSFCEIGNENWARFYWGSGYLQYERGPQSKKAHISGWVSGGGSIIDRQKFLKLGGFDGIYAPFYSEDADLGYRAWKSGYKLLWDPDAKIEHLHESTISKFPRHFLDYVKERNRLLTVWRNITDPKLLRDNRLALFLRVLTGPNYIKIIRAANRQIKSFPPPLVTQVLTDNQIFEMFK